MGNRVRKRRRRRKWNEVKGRSGFGESRLYVENGLDEEGQSRPSVREEGGYQVDQSPKIHNRINIIIRLNRLNEWREEKELIKTLRGIRVD